MTVMGTNREGAVSERDWDMAQEVGSTGGESGTNKAKVRESVSQWSERSHKIRTDCLLYLGGHCHWPFCCPHLRVLL